MRSISTAAAVAGGGGVVGAVTTAGCVGKANIALRETASEFTSIVQ